MSNTNTLLSYCAYRFLINLKDAIRHWHEKPTLADQRSDAILVRLQGLAADIVRIMDAAGGEGCDLQNIVYEINVGFDEDAEDKPDVLLSMQVDDLERQFDLALCRNWEADDVARPMRDGIQWVGGKSATSPDD